ncbi:ABC-three component system middle component 2 [Kitasatospora purpeofusca]|uniref:ABC-three component system middle component 2 n=1 Tax=Kitasatospora purpeofusca TaxID=67352 RepID=UPI0004BFAC62|nr:ABC-three component system middle component 2 [Kitasatospora purpeofusca]
MQTHRPVIMPEDEVQFRLAQLLLLLDAVADHDLHGASLERIGYYDFLSANPFLVVPANDRDAGRLRLAGFDPQVLAYASSSQRFTSRRERIQHDLALLVAYGCCEVRNHEKALSYAITDTGRTLSSHFTATYATSFSTAASIVVRRLRRLSDKALRDQTTQWLRPAGHDGPAAALLGILGTGPVPAFDLETPWGE